MQTNVKSITRGLKNNKIIMEKVLSSQEQNQLGEIKSQIRVINKKLDSLLPEKIENRSKVRLESFRLAKIHMKTALLFIEDGLKY